MSEDPRKLNVSSTGFRLRLRPLATPDDYEQCVALQRATWGPAFTELVPASLLMASQTVGGVAAGAFDAGGRLLGFVFGISGIRDGRAAHWSDMLAVRPEARGRGVGLALKLYQRRRLRRVGILAARWTFDPLVAVNAHFNLARLGARVVAYVPDFYGDRTRNRLARGLGTDRVLVEWDLTAPLPPATPRRRQSQTPDAWRSALVIRPDGTGVPPGSAGLPAAPVVLVEIPSDVHALVRRGQARQAARWRTCSRRAFGWYLGHGYRVDTFLRDGLAGRCVYVLRRSSPSGAGADVVAGNR